LKKILIMLLAISLFSVCGIAEAISGETGLPPVETDESQLSSVAKMLVKKFKLEGNTVFTDEQLSPILKNYEEREITAEELQEVKNSLTRFYIANGYVNSGVIIPDQQIKDNIITLRVIEGKLSKIEIISDTWLRKNYILKRVELANPKDKPFNVNVMQERLQLMKQDPRIENIHADFGPGLELGEGILKIQVEEARAYHIWTKFNNHHSPSIGAYRGEIGVRHDNLTGWGDSLSALYGITEGLDDYAVNYTIPLTKLDTTLSFDVDRAKSVVVAEPFSQLDIKSETTSYSATLRHPFYKTLSREFAMDLQLEKSISKTYLPGDDPFSFTGSSDAENKVTALRFSQDWVNRTVSQVFAMRSTFSFGLDMWDATILDTEPDGEFFSWLGQFQWLGRIDSLKSQLMLRGILRMSNDPVLPAEKFVIGGSSTVRGYRENQMTTDNGAIGSLEWRWSLFHLKIPGLSKGEQDGEFQLCPFFDIGKGWNTDSDDPSPDSIYSAGIGARWLVSKKIYTEIYWGEALRDVENPGEYDLQDDGIHFEISAEF